MKQSFRVHLSESSLSRIQDKLTKHAIGALTTFRGNLTRRENLQRNRKLLAELRINKLQITKVMGNYIENYNPKLSDEEIQALPPEKRPNEVGEEYFIAVNPTEGDDNGVLEELLFKLGEKFEQDTILSVPFGQGAFLITTSDYNTDDNSKGTRTPQGKAIFGEIGEFLSRINGRPFVFKEAIDIEEIKTIGGFRGAHALKDTNTNDVILNKTELDSIDE